VAPAGAQVAGLAPEVRELIARIDAMMQTVAVAGPAAGGTMDAMREAAAEATRSLFAEAGGRMTEVERIDDHAVPVEGAEITVRVYTPAGAGPFPALLHFHGGAWTMGSIDWPTFASYAREVAARTPCAVAAVEYRLAPEARFPVPVEDCYASLLWLAGAAGELGIDPARIVVGGDSAGANLAAAVCLMARDRGGPPIAAQLLEIGAPDHAHVEDYPSATAFATGFGLPTEALVHGRSVYFAAPDDALHPYASPMLAGSLAGLPPAHVFTAELDPLRDCGEAYGRRLRDSGVPATINRQAGHIHGSSFLLHPRWEGARAWRDQVIEALRARFGH
jgi:acetyl esterase